MNNVQHVFIIGSKGIPARYGGYETFVENLTKDRVNKQIQYHVACLAKDSNRFNYNNADCFNVKVPNIGPAKAIYYDKQAFKESLNYIRQNKIEHPIVYVLTCRIGPWFSKYVNKLHKLGGKVFLNPDGHEWMRAKWSKPVRQYWKLSEKLMVKYSDFIICDSKNIESYIHEIYYSFNPKTAFIAYGADITPSILKDDDSMFLNWLNKYNLKPGEYYLSVGRFVPENNFETMLREFMKSKTTKSFAVMTNDNPKLYDNLDKKLHFSRDPRIKFVGTIYNAELLKKIRENAFAYFHGHSVGGTNPSLLEALSYTKLNLLFDVGFNREVAEDGALYWTKEKGNLASLIDQSDALSFQQIDEYSFKAKERIRLSYSWSHIVYLYEKVFLND